MSARVLVDQCVSRRMVEPPLNAIGADTAYVEDIARGAADIDILEVARREDRILLTEDYDFGELIFHRRRPPPPGLIHLALEGMSKDERDAKFATELAHLLEIAPKNFVVFSRHAPRTRPLP